MITRGEHTHHQPGCRMFGLLVRMFILLESCCAMDGHAQSDYSCLRVYMDNDFLAFRNKDGAYTNGMRADYWRRSLDKRSSPLLKALRPPSWSKTTRHDGFSIMQTMFTANSTRHSERRPGDYPYSGALFGIFSESVSNAENGNSIQLDYIGGIMGPHALAAQTQTGFHRMIGGRLPAGWDNQLPTALLINFNLTIEGRFLKMFRKDNLYARIGLKCGTLLNAVSISLAVRSDAKPLPAFLQFGAISGRRRFQCRLYFVPELHLVCYNALLQGSIIQRRTGNGTEINHFVFTTAIGMLFRYQKLGMSFTYKSHSGLIRHHSHKTLGNVSLYFLFRD